MDDHDDEQVSLLEGSLFLLESAKLARPHPRDRHELGLHAALAARYYQEGRHLDALPLFEDVATRSAQLLGPRDVDTLIAAGNEAVTRAELEQWATALPQLESAAEIRDVDFGALHPLTLDALDALGAALRISGQTAPAWSAHERVVAGRMRSLGRTHPATLTARLGLALTRFDDGDYRAASDLLSTAAQDAETAPGTPPLLLAALRGHLAIALAYVGQRDQAERLLARAADDLAAVVGTNHPDAIALRSYRQQLPDAGVRAGEGPTPHRAALSAPPVRVPRPRPPHAQPGPNH